VKLVRLFAVAAFLSLLNACATVPRPTAVAPEFWQQPVKKVAISVQPLPKPASYKMGAQGLLDMAINNAIANGWDTHVESLVFEPYQELADELASKIKARGFLTEVIPVDLVKLKKYEPTPDQEKKPMFEWDLTPLGRVGREYLLLVKVDSVGTARDYYGFVPLSAPRGYLQGYATLIDVRSNEVIWWKSLLVNKGVNGDWDQPPAYSNLSQAIDQAVEQSRQDVVTSLFSSVSLSSPTTAH